MLPFVMRRALVIGGLLTWFCLGTANAMSISPILVELTPARRVASVSMTNPGDQPKTFQAQLLAWSQRDGTDQYAETDDLIITPVIALIAPGSTQIFRVAVRSKSAATVEQAYRLILEDVTEESRPQTSVGVSLRYRFSLPVMSAPTTPVRASPRWSLCSAPAGKVCVRLDNDGNRRLRLSTVTLEGQDGWRRDVPGVGTVLAGAWKEWRLDSLPGQGAPSRVSATGEGESLGGEFAPPR